MIHRCTECRRTMISEHAWRQGGRAAETYSHSLRQGLCSACRMRLIRSELPAKPRASRAAPGSTYRKASPEELEEMLEEYELIRDDCSSIAEAAKRLGLNFHTLDKRLYNARRRGDPRGRPPLAQYERAIDRGAPYGHEKGPRRPPQQLSAAA